MSRDKYSENHTISVDGGSGTLSVDGSLDVSGQLSVGSFEADSIQLANSVVQKFRIGGNHFKPASSTHFTNISYGLFGQLIFGTTSATVSAAVDLPHGAIITGIRVVGKATGANDSVSVTLSRSDGTSKLDIATGTYSSVSGFGDIDETESGISTVNLNLDRFYFVRATGIEVTTSAQIYFVDVLYTIQNFPQDANSNPV